jgi:WD40 repeat protein
VNRSCFLSALVLAGIATAREGVAKEKATLRAGEAPVFSVAFSPDGRGLASGDEAGTVTIWDLGTSRPLQSLKMGSEVVHSLAYSPDGRWLGAGGIHIDAAARGVSGEVRVWEAATGRARLTHKEPRIGFHGVAFSRSGKTLAAAGRGSPDQPKSGALKMWDVATGHAFPDIPLKGRPVTCVAFGPDAKTIFAGGPDGVLQWTIANPRIPKTFSNSISPVLSLDVSPDGKTLAVSGVDAYSARHALAQLWDIARHGKIEDIRFRERVGNIASVAFSPDGKLLAMGTPEETAEVILWDIASAKRTSSFGGHTGGVLSVAFSPDGRTVASGSLDGTIKLWDSREEAGGFWAGTSQVWDGEQLWAEKVEGKSADLSDNRSFFSGAKLVDVRTLGHVEELRLSWTQIDDDGLRAFAHLADLKELSLEGAKVTGSGLAYLKDLKSLARLDLRKTPVTDRGLLGVGELTNLRSLRLDTTTFSDRGLAHLKDLKSLRELRIFAFTLEDAGAGSRLTPDSLTNLETLEGLETLQYFARAVSPASVASVARLPRLKHLDISGRLDPASIEALSGAESLEVLRLGDVDGLDDRALLPLTRLPNLKEASIGGYWTPRGMTDYLRRLPRMSEGERRAYALVRAMQDLSASADSARNMKQRLALLGAPISGDSPEEAAERRKEVQELYGRLDDDQISAREKVAILGEKANLLASEAFKDDMKGAVPVLAGVYLHSGIVHPQLKELLTGPEWEALQERRRFMGQ